MTSAELRREQQSDPDLQKWRECALHGHPIGSKQNYRFQMKCGLLYRVFDDKGDNISQLVLPKSVRLALMEVAHEGPLEAHFGIIKTVSKIKRDYDWPGMFSEIRRFCQSCDRCQRVVSRGKVAKVPIGEVPLINTPFQWRAVEIIGPILTQNQNRK